MKLGNEREFVRQVRRLDTIYLKIHYSSLGRGDEMQNTYIKLKLIQRQYFKEFSVNISR